MTTFRVVLPLCGGNIDTTLLGRCLDRGLAADGRLITFNVIVSDRPGGISELAKLIASVGVSIKVLTNRNKQAFHCAQCAPSNFNLQIFALNGSNIFGQTHTVLYIDKINIFLLSRTLSMREPGLKLAHSLSE